MKCIGTSLGVFLVFTVASWGADQPSKKFNASSSHPHHSQMQTGNAVHPHLNSSNPLPAKTQSARDSELSRLEHQNTTQLHARSTQRNVKASGTAPHVHPETRTNSSGINFSYHPPRNASTATSGGRKH